MLKKLGFTKIARSKELTPTESLMAGTVAGGVAALATYPVDVMVTGKQSKTWIAKKKAIESAKGLGKVKELYAGTGLKIGKGALGGAVIFAVYNAIANQIKKNELIKFNK